MNPMRTVIVVTFLALAGVCASIATGEASAFFAWRVADVPPDDTLNVRAWPSSQSQILVAYPNHTRLSLTGKCTGGVDLNAIAGWPAWKQRQAVRYVWCEVWLDPKGTGHYRAAWVYGKYIRPA